MAFLKVLGSLSLTNRNVAEVRADNICRTYFGAFGSVYADSINQVFFKVKFGVTLIYCSITV